MALDRDADLQAVFDAADHIGPDGIRALTDKLQSYRRSARDACTFVQNIQTNIEMVSNVAMLRAKLEAINNTLAQWQWEMELDHIEARDFIND
jgi:hypothetical protein